MLRSGLVSWVGASHWVNLIAPFPLGQNCPRKIAMSIPQFRLLKVVLLSLVPDLSKSGMADICINVGESLQI